MLCLFAGPTKLADPNRRLVVVNSHPHIRAQDDLGQKPLFQDAGVLQRAITYEFDGIDICEHSPNMEYHKEGLVWVELTAETPEERYYRRMSQGGLDLKFIRMQWPFNAHRDPFFDEPRQERVTGKILTNTPTLVWASEQICDRLHTIPTAAWFPEQRSFGNGVTTNHWDKGPDGTLCLFSWCVVRKDFERRIERDQGIQKMLCEIIEQ